MKPRYYKFQAEIVPKQKLIHIYKQILEGNNIRFLKQLSKEKVCSVVITQDIPMEEFTTTKSYSDFTAFQTDDRFWSKEITDKRYNLEICRNLIIKALENYNTEPILIKEQTN